jgi:hypothetical protein
VNAKIDTAAIVSAASFTLTFFIITNYGLIKNGLLIKSFTTFIVGRWATKKISGIFKTVEEAVKKVINLIVISIFQLLCQKDFLLVTNFLTFRPEPRGTKLFTQWNFY